MGKEREYLINYIKANSSMYLFTDFSNYSITELETLKEIVENSKSQMEKLFNSDNQNGVCSIDYKSKESNLNSNENETNI
ncbi:MAG: hypothetical protein ACE5DN_00435 [Flavobacteriales bacterium]